MHRYKLTIEYDGTPYCGWQRMPDRMSVQEELETAAERFCGARVEIYAAGRTDAGVHASGMTAHVDFARDYEPYTVMSAINQHLLRLDEAPHDNERRPRFISVVQAERVSEEFHARFSATRRHYVYRILNRRAPAALDANRVWHVPEQLNVEAMREAAKHLLGHHDFTTFRDSQCQAKSPMKTLDVLEVTAMGEEIVIYTSARSFLHHQVRIMAGSLKAVGGGRWQPDEMKTALAAKDRRAGGETAPPQGLCLVRVDY